MKQNEYLRWVPGALLAAAVLVGSGPLHAQLTLTSAVTLALQASPRVKMAEAELDRAKAGLSQSKDVYVPTLSVGGGLGYPFGFSAGAPSVFSLTSTSLVYNYAQRKYVDSARYNVEAAAASLADVRETVAADAASTYLAVQRDQYRDAAMQQEGGNAQRLVEIVTERLEAGRDAALDLTTARLTAAQIRLSMLHAANETEADRAHLSRLTGLPVRGLTVSLGAYPEPALPATTAADDSSPALRAAFQNAAAKERIAKGDSRYAFIPQVALGVEYHQYAPYQGQDQYFTNYKQYYADLGVQITLPLYDRSHKDKARESFAAASSALHEAEALRDRLADGQLKLKLATAELQARLEVARLEQQLQQQQLGALQVQLNTAAVGTATQLTPKDQQTARIAEREKYLAVLDATYRLQTTEVDLLRQSGQVQEWLRTAVHTTELPQP